MGPAGSSALPESAAHSIAGLQALAFHRGATVTRRVRAVSSRAGAPAQHPRSAADTRQLGLDCNWGVSDRQRRCGDPGGKGGARWASGAVA